MPKRKQNEAKDGPCWAPELRKGRSESLNSSVHVSDHDLERYYLGQIVSEDEVARVEDHLIGCGECAERAAEAQDYVDAMRRGIIEGDYDRKIKKPREPR